MRTIIIFTLFYILGCSSYDIEKIHPTFLDPSRGYGRVYNTKRVKAKQCSDKTYEFNYSGQNVLIPNMAGYVCFKREEVTDALANYDQYETEQCEDQ